MAVTYTSGASGAAVTQTGNSVERSPEGLETFTLVVKGKPTAVETWADAIPRGTACTVTGYASLTAVAKPRITYEGAFATGYAVYQGAPDGEGTSESNLDVNYSSESRTVELVTSADASTNTFKVAFVAPTVTASYVALSKPGAFRFASLVNSEPDPDIEEAIVTAVGSTTARELVEGTDYVLKTESKWTERRNVGGIWHMSEQHAKLIANKVYE
jgi:hypothetical protein